MPAATKLFTTGKLSKLVTLIRQCTDSFHSNYCVCRGKHPAAGQNLISLRSCSWLIPELKIASPRLAQQSHQAGRAPRQIHSRSRCRCWNPDGEDQKLSKASHDLAG